MERRVLPLPLGISQVNAYHFPGATPALVDCGTNQPRSLQLLADLNPGKLVLTHGHIDHAGGAKSLQEAGWKVCAHPEESPHIETFRAESVARNLEYGVSLRAHGMPEPVAKAMEGAPTVDTLLDDVTPDRPLHDGPIQLGDAEFELRHLPGHTEGSIILVGESDIITGDTLLQHITSNAIQIRPCERGRFAGYLQALDAMRAYVGLQALPGHYEPFTITDAVLDNHFDRHELRRTKILELLADAPRTAWQIRKALWPNMPDAQSFLAMSEVIGHLETMEDEGLAMHLESKEGRRWTSKESR